MTDTPTIQTSVGDVTVRGATPAAIAEAAARRRGPLPSDPATVADDPVAIRLIVRHIVEPKLRRRDVVRLPYADRYRLLVAVLEADPDTRAQLEQGGE